MKTNYLLLIVGVLLIGCNKPAENQKKNKTFATKKEQIKPEDVFTNKLISNIEYQVEAFKIGYEKSSNPELKNYLNTNLPKLQKLLSDYKSAAIAQKVEIKTMTEEHQKDLYKLTMADIKGFDKIFVLYYKDFLNKTIEDITSNSVENESFNTLKNNYGNILYEQKLYFDVL
ncbi:DUF4142 domain-containing protein [Paenimyroides viscosum]|uniref:DUF4142 domain-containing protein n=1 Tax=Paenimyroides viscosum TaxID=2488729 RepID=A0A3P1B5M3_9FLAO|nr:DUF4142 domain-containing protein [Paenimyroides viscosum]RRA96304.1 hypothetical protein EG242_03535 [Paenimyroides viscosum]